MPSKRVSLKGKGADLFFGDYTPEQLDASSAPPEDVIDSPAVELPVEPIAATANPLPRPPRRANEPRPQLEPVSLSPEPDDSNFDFQSISVDSERSSGTSIERDTFVAETTSASKLASILASKPSPQSPTRNDRLIASSLAGDQANDTQETVDAIRRIVRVPGREVSFVRMTGEEKAELTDIVYAYKRRGQKTSENEINRIALNYLLNDYHQRGSESMLARVLASLLA
jgi:hypothetical protein